MITTRIIASLFLLGLLGACNTEQSVEQVQNTTNEGSVEKEQPQELKPLDDKSNNVSTEVVASVNNSDITRSQLDHAMTRLFSRQLGSDKREKLSEKVLVSLIDSRLMAVLEEEKLDKQELELLMTKVEAFKEELLVKKYITKNITPQVITEDKVYQYYLDHQSDFGGGNEKTFEVIQTNVILTDDKRKSLLLELSKLSNTKDWSVWFASNKHMDVSYKKVTSRVGLLKHPLKDLVEVTEEGETSPLENGEKLTIVRVNKANKIPAKPFKQVSRKIRRMMAPQALKKSIKVHLKELKKNANIKSYLFESDRENITLTNSSDSTGVRK